LERLLSCTGQAKREWSSYQAHQVEQTKDWNEGQTMLVSRVETPWIAMLEWEIFPLLLPDLVPFREKP